MAASWLQTYPLAMAPITPRTINSQSHLSAYLYSDQKDTGLRYTALLLEELLSLRFSENRRRVGVEVEVVVSIGVMHGPFVSFGESLDSTECDSISSPGAGRIARGRFQGQTNSKFPSV